MGRTKAFVLAAVVAGLAACGSPGYVDTSSVQYGANGQCYYVDSPAEVVALQTAGLCPVNWAPMLMPIAWHSRYAYYYDSPSYYNSYVPRAGRTTYVTHVHVYESQHSSSIVRTAPKARSFTQQKASSGSFKTGRQGGDSGSSRTTRSFTSQRSSSSFKSGRR